MAHVTAKAQVSSNIYDIDGVLSEFTITPIDSKRRIKVVINTQILKAIADQLGIGSKIIVHGKVESQDNTVYIMATTIIKL